jgi:metallophosphoesterase (TIGR00282 family)
MRILMIGDVVGKSGRDAISSHLPKLRESLNLDIVVVNGENAAHGFGITDKICASFYKYGADVISTGNHVWDQRPIMNYIDNDPKLLRPINFPEGTPGRGFGVYEALSGKKVLVVNAMGRLYMDPLDDPFAAIEKLLSKTILGVDVSAILVDFHAEASSEKQAVGHVLDGRVSVVVGTHTHTPTSDYRVLQGGTAYQTDLGMTGDYNSVIGMQKKAASERFTTKMPKVRLEPASGEGTLCGLFIQTNDQTGLANSVAPVRIGGCLNTNRPQI